MKHIIWIITFILVSGVAFAADIYASNRTSGGSGTFGDPYALTTALSTATAGDTVYLFSGNYTTGGGYYTSNSGTDENNRLIIQGYNSSDKPTLIGNTSIVTQVLDIPTEYTTIRNIIVREYSEGRRTIRVTGNHVTLDGVESYYMGSNYSSGNHNINVYSASYLIVNNSLIDRSTRNGLYISTSYPSGYSDNCTIENSEFRNLEDHHAINIFPDTMDNPVLPISGCIIRNNYFHDLPTQSAMFLRHFKDFQIYNNIIINVGEGISISSGDNNTPMESYEANGLIANNLFANIVDGYAINNWVANNLTIKNNIFTGEFYSDNVIQFNENYVDADAGDPPIFNHDINNNIYWNTTGGISWDWNDTVYSTLAAFTAATGQDSDSYYGNPLILNSSGGDYTLNETSYGIDNGLNLSIFFNYDYDYILRPQGNEWDIGPYESNHTIETITTPIVNITYPSNNQNFLEYENITINISASDSNGNISYIEIYANNTLIGNLTSSPYSFIWNETGTGIYTIYANAYDNDSQNTTSSTIIIRVNMTNDAVSGIHFNDTFTDIDATDLLTHTPNYGSKWIYGYQTGSYSVADINTNRIDYTGARQVNSGYIAIANDTVPVADYNVTVTVVTHDTTTDTHIVVARWQNSSNFYAFIDSRVNVTSSHGIWKVVSGVNTKINSSGCGLPNNGDVKTLEVRDNLIIAYRNGVQVCNATDSDITQPGKGGFGHGATLISTGDDLDLQVSDNFLISYTPDNSSNSSDNYSNSLPIVNITYPLNQSVFENNSNITVNATATDSDGNITYVEFYANTTVIGNDTTNPYSILWENTTTANYYIIAKAYDNASNYTISDGIYVTINSSSNSTNSTGNSSENETLEIIIPEGLFDDYSNLTNRTREQLENLQHIHFRNSFGRINFTSNITINRSINLTGHIIITNRSIYINSSHIPEFNVSARLDFYNVTYQYPIAYRDGIICSGYCSNQTQNTSSELFYFTVSGFSNYSIENAACGDGSCNALETCDTCSADCGICVEEDNGGGGGSSSRGGSSYYPIITNTSNQTNTTNTTSNEDNDTSIISNQENNNYPTDNSATGISEISTDEQKEPSLQNPSNISATTIQYMPWIVSLVVAVLLSLYITMVVQLKNKEKNNPINNVINKSINKIIYPVNEISKREITSKNQNILKIQETIFKTQQYYNKMIAKGNTEVQIIAELKKIGWTDVQINYVFSQIKKR
jgi:hypothetical protein